MTVHRMLVCPAKPAGAGLKRLSQRSGPPEAGRLTTNSNKLMSAKHKANHTDTGRAAQRVCLELTRPDAESVCIAGSFNDWHPGVSPMLRLTNGTWAKELILVPGCYEYRFVVDGEWVDDPMATDYVPNPFGGMNAVLTVASPQTAPARRQRLSSSTKTALSRVLG